MWEELEVREGMQLDGYGSREAVGIKIQTVHAFLFGNCSRKGGDLVGCHYFSFPHRWTELRREACGTQLRLGLCTRTVTPQAMQILYWSSALVHMSASVGRGVCCGKLGLCYHKSGEEWRLQDGEKGCEGWCIMVGGGPGSKGWMTCWGRSTDLTVWLRARSRHFGPVVGSLWWRQCTGVFNY